MSEEINYLEDAEYEMRQEELRQETIDDESYYLDWLSDNKSELQKEFLGHFENEFADYCKDKFKEEVEHKRLKHG